jgi:ABC-type phosphate transport system substrate-binding protein
MVVTVRGRRRRLAFWGCLVGVALLRHGGLLAQSQPEEAVIAVIVAVGNADPGPLSSTAVASIFRRKRQLWADRSPIVPVNLPASHPLRRAFSLRILGSSPQDLQAYWNDQYFHGVLPPAVVASEEAVLRFVVETPGAIGYVWACSVDRRVLVVATLAVAGSGGPCAR